MMTQRLLNPRFALILAVWAVLMGVFSGRASAMPRGSLGLSPAVSSTRTAQIERIMTVLSKPEAQVHLRAMGIRLPELRSRLSKLDDAQLARMAQKADTVKAGGQLGLLIAALVIAILIVIFIAIVKRV